MPRSVGRAICGAPGRVIAVLAIALASMVTFSLSAGASHTSGLEGKSANQVWAQVTAAANAKGSVHVVEKPFLCCGDTNVFGTSGVLVIDAGQSEGKQSLSSGGIYGHATILVVPGMAYVQGDAQWTSRIMTLPPGYAGKWLAITPSTPGYSSTIYGVTLGSLLTAEKPAGHLTVKPETSINGKKVIGLSGGLVRTGWPTDVKGSTVVYISAVAPYLPLETVFHVTENGRKTIVTDTFSMWGEQISVTAPASSVPLIG